MDRSSIVNLLSASLMSQEGAAGAKKRPVRVWSRVCKERWPAVAGESVSTEVFQPFVTRSVHQARRAALTGIKHCPDGHSVRYVVRVIYNRSNAPTRKGYA